ncbi:MAG: Rne/Rng family ribonuclease, partial [Kordiimonas sp.]
MSTRMLIDARHSEETRVTIVKGSRVEEFDYESATRRQLKGNIYLARVTRVEPSLQAAFVEYGGNRHGFLAFSEIHPDYYQIPVEDREALIAEETEEAKTRQQETDAEEEKPKPRRRRGRKSAAEKAAEADSVKSEVIDEPAEEDETSKTEADTKASDDNEEEVESAVKDSDEDDKDAEIEEAANRRRGLRALKRKYSIQEVIKRRQVLLIQVVKEERGNKGAALTTYMSLAGRYCVLMPNSTHAGGISRKISNISDRKKLKQIISSLGVSDEMGLIVRTAGLQRTKTEIKRDYDYLLRLWNGIRKLTLKSIAPALVYEEGNLIKRTIRDLYVREVDEILVEGEEGYRSAKDFMKLLMPSHAKKVQHYRDHIPLFHRYQVESHLEAMYQPIVQLKSGGYIVINPTEALISIDVNSGRATKEHNIEETAVKTNLEAAEEVARQLRLRDMAGLVVIDFIDMEDRSNNRAVERKMKEMLKNDRARIQVGRISSFGLMEMSRQRLRPNLLEVAMETCQTCAGSGIVRSVESASIMALRQLEEEGIRGRSSIVRVAANPEVAIYLLNKKRAALSDLERRYDYVIEVLAQPSLGQSDIEITRETANGADNKPAPTADAVVTLESSTPNHASGSEEKKITDSGEEEQQPKKKRRRRRRRRRGGNDDASAEARNSNEVS